MSSSMIFRRATAFSAGAARRSFTTTSPRSVAKITIIGHLADTPELHQTSSGRELLRYAVASNSGPKDNRQTSWFRVASFTEGPTRDFMLSIPKGYVNPPTPDICRRASEQLLSMPVSAARVFERNMANKKTDSAMVYVEGDASMNTYQDPEGNNRSSLNVVQRKSQTPECSRR